MEPTREQSTERIDGTDGMETEVEEEQADKMNVGGATEPHTPSSQTRHVQPVSGTIDQSHHNEGIINNAQIQYLIGGNQSINKANVAVLPSRSPLSSPSEGSWKEKLPPLAEKPGGVLEIKVEHIREGDDQKQARIMAERDKDMIYPNFTDPRGLCLIINNENFEQSPRRVETNVDRENLKQLFEQLGYRVQIKDDLTAKEIGMAMKGYAKNELHKNAESAVVVVLTHGGHEKLLGTDNNSISVHKFLDYLSPLKAPYLRGKPKIIFIQTCRGGKRDQGVERVDSTDSDSLPDTRRKEKPLRTSREADFFVGYSTPPHYVSWRNEQLGSWFIQAICQIFPKFAHKHDLATLMTMVNQRVCDCFENSDEEADFRQISEFTSRLRKKFYFFPGIAIQGSSAI